ncbi:hypothetical protein [Salirhabdus sp. Marseille-P4669]|uniref:hypothetical protein n=1 Tax=Salirhabdus sp. Marseille-P4669 TaxID=2042310 RepID=UPI000C79AF8D|nr:hypothetical protein [Salirhabdus sp. Marseille-P4669]
MDNEKGVNQLPKFDDLTDRLISEGNEQGTISMKTNLDPKDPIEDNPYFDKNKTYTKEELDKFRNFFGGS